MDASLLPTILTAVQDVVDLAESPPEGQGDEDTDAVSIAHCLAEAVADV